MRMFYLFLAAAALLPVASGCSPKESAPVTGTVKVNGQAVEGATISFAPVGQGRTATGVTQADGSYELDYTPGVKGAKIGENTVTITTYSPREVDDDGTVMSEGRPELFPPEYNENASVTREVKSGENVFDFDVEATQDSYPRTEED